MQKRKAQYNMENNEFKKICVKSRTSHYFSNIIKLEDFDLDNILIDKITRKNFKQKLMC